MKEDGSTKNEKKQIVCTGKTDSEIPSTINIMKTYANLKLTDRGYFVEIPSNMKLPDSQPIPGGVDNLTFLEKYCGCRKLENLRDMAANQSAIDDKGYADRFDLYIIKGIVIRQNKGERKDGTRYGVYTIKDESLTQEAEIVEVNGEEIVIPPVITVWTPPRFITYDKESELAFVGTIGIRKDTKEVLMNAIAVMPAGIVIEMSE